MKLFSTLSLATIA